MIEATERANQRRDAKTVARHEGRLADGAVMGAHGSGPFCGMNDEAAD